MKIVVQTQHMENYGAHDWDGVGECPQYWKAKGGDTYVVPKVTVAEAQSDQFWNDLTVAIERDDEGFREYVIGMELVDDVDYDESNIKSDWEAITSLVPVIQDGKRVFLATCLKEAEFYWRDGVTSTMEQWKQVCGRRDDFRMMVNLEDGRSLLYSEWCKEQEAA